MLNRWTEKDKLLDRLEKEGIGCIAFSPLAQGMLSTKYLKGMPAGSRATQGKSLSQDLLSKEAVKRIGALNDIAKKRGQSLAQMAIAWVLRDERMTSALIGASRPEQITEIVGALEEHFLQQEGAFGDRQARRGQQHQFVEAVEHGLAQQAT